MGRAGVDLQADSLIAKVYRVFEKAGKSLTIDEVEAKSGLGRRQVENSITMLVRAGLLLATSKVNRKRQYGIRTDKNQKSEVSEESEKWRIVREMRRVEKLCVDSVKDGRSIVLSKALHEIESIVKEVLRAVGPAARWR